MKRHVEAVEVVLFHQKNPLIVIPLFSFVNMLFILNALLMITKPNVLFVILIRNEIFTDILTYYGVNPSNIIRMKRGSSSVLEKN